MDEIHAKLDVLIRTSEALRTTNLELSIENKELRARNRLLATTLASLRKSITRLKRGEPDGQKENKAVAP